MATNRYSDTFTDKISEYLEESIKKAIGDTFDDAVKKAVEEVNAKRDEIISKTALNIMSHVSLQDFGNTLRIEINKVEK